MSILCPCGGGRAYSRDEMIAFDIAEGEPWADTESISLGWCQILGPDDYYCPHEDDVLLPDEVEAARRMES